MRHTYIFIISTISILCSMYSQESKFSMELNYPITLGNNFIAEEYRGVIDLGLKYTFKEISVFQFGVSFHTATLLNRPDFDNQRPALKTSVYCIQPRAFIALATENLKTLTPAIGIGYTVAFFDLSGGSETVNLANPNQTRNGFNLNFGIAYHITDHLFIQSQYDFIVLNTDNEANISYNKNIQLLNLGIGYRF